MGKSFLWSQARRAASTTEVDQQREARPVALRHPACPGLSDGSFRGAQQEDNPAVIRPDTCPSRGWSAQNRSSERCWLLSCCSAQVKDNRDYPLDAGKKSYALHH